jgi:hypothetical protein
MILSKFSCFSRSLSTFFLPVCCQHYVKKKSLIETFFYRFPHSVPLIAEMQQISFENE